MIINNAKNVKENKCRIEKIETFFSDTLASQIWPPKFSHSCEDKYISNPQNSQVYQIDINNASILRCGSGRDDLSSYIVYYIINGPK